MRPTFNKIFIKLIALIIFINISFTKSDEVEAPFKWIDTPWKVTEGCEGKLCCCPQKDTFVVFLPPSDHNNNTLTVQASWNDGQFCERFNWNSESIVQWPFGVDDLHKNNDQFWYYDENNKEFRVVSLIEDGVATAEINIFESTTENECTIRMIQTVPITPESNNSLSLLQWVLIIFLCLVVFYLFRFYRRKYLLELGRRQLAESAYNEALEEARRQKSSGDYKRFDEQLDD